MEENKSYQGMVWPILILALFVVMAGEMIRLTIGLSRWCRAQYGRGNPDGCNSETEPDAVYSRRNEEVGISMPDFGFGTRNKESQTGTEIIHEEPTNIFGMSHGHEWPGAAYLNMLRYTDDDTEVAGFSRDFQTKHFDTNQFDTKLRPVSNSSGSTEIDRWRYENQIYP